VSCKETGRVYLLGGVLVPGHSLSAPRLVLSERKKYFKNISALSAVILKNPNFQVRWGTQDDLENFWKIGGVFGTRLQIFRTQGLWFHYFYLFHCR